MKNYPVHLLQEKFITVGAVFENDLTVEHLLKSEIPLENHQFAYTFKAEADIDLKVGDFALVHANEEAKIVRVVEIHNTPQLDSQAKFKYKWIIQKLDFSAYRKRLEEEQLISALLNRLDFLEQQQALQQRIAQAKLQDLETAEFAEKLAVLNEK